jgi:hypothetical protein
MDYFVTFVILGSVRSRMLQKPESLQSEIRNPKSTIERASPRNTKPVMRNPQPVTRNS